MRGGTTWGDKRQARGNGRHRYHYGQWDVARRRRRWKEPSAQDYHLHPSPTIPAMPPCKFAAEGRSTKKGKKEEGPRDRRNCERERERKGEGEKKNYAFVP